jgi:DNA-binding response OmpR family regulator
MWAYGTNGEEKSPNQAGMSRGGTMAAKILLVEDDKNRRDAVRLILKSSDYLVVEAPDHATALTLLANEMFDLILLDITLPDKRGFRVLEFLEKNHIASKVMVITGVMGLANVVRSATLEARETVTRPSNPGDLLKSIEHVLSDRAQTNLRLQIIRAGDFIKSTPTGDLDKETSQEGLAQIAAVGAGLQGYTVLIDLRDVRSRLTTAQIYQLASELATYGKTFRRKTAVLARDDKDFDQALFFEMAAQNRGFRVKAFSVFEDALTWLSNVAQPKEDQLHEHSTASR